MFLSVSLALAMVQAAPARTAIVSPGRWTVDYGRLSCTLARRVGDANSPIVAFNARLGHVPGEFLIMDGGAALAQRLNGELHIDLGAGEPLTMRARQERRNGHPVLRLTPVPDGFLARIAGANRLAVRSGTDEVLALPLVQAGAAIEALSQCNDDLLRSWGIDVRARHALSRQPIAGDFGWAAGISPATETALVFAVDVSERGRPLNCRVVVSSGNERMDRAFCTLVLSHARFEPGLDAQRRAVAAQYVTVIRWLVPNY